METTLNKVDTMLLRINTLRKDLHKKVMTLDYKSPTRNRWRNLTAYLANINTDCHDYGSSDVNLSRLAEELEWLKSL
ncbi:MAG: hypothetical protein WC441_04935 [Patescibacteria group bacterium]